MLICSWCSGSVNWLIVSLIWLSWESVMVWPLSSITLPFLAAFQVSISSAAASCLTLASCCLILTWSLLRSAVIWSLMRCCSPSSNEPGKAMPSRYSCPRPRSRSDWNSLIMRLVLCSCWKESKSLTFWPSVINPTSTARCCASANSSSPLALCIKSIFDCW